MSTAWRGDELTVEQLKVNIHVEHKMNTVFNPMSTLHNNSLLNHEALPNLLFNLPPFTGSLEARVQAVWVY